MGLSSHPQGEGSAAFNSALLQSGFALCFFEGWAVSKPWLHGRFEPCALMIRCVEIDAITLAAFLIKRASCFFSIEEKLGRCAAAPPGRGKLLDGPPAP